MSTTKRGERVNKTVYKRTAGALVATVLFLSILSTGVSEQPTPPDLFNPVYQIYQYIQSYYYKPESIDDQKALYGAMKGVVEQLDDPYSEFFTPEERVQFDESIEGEFTGVGIEIAIVDDVLTVITPLVGTPAEAAGVQAGDLILAIDGESTEGITLSGAAVRIRGERGTTVVLTILHEGASAPEEISVVRDDITIDAVTSEIKADGDVGYVRILRFDTDTVLQLDQALASFDYDQIKGLILDLRNNPGGLMPAAISVSSRFVDEGVVLQVTDRLSGEKKYWSKGNRLPNVPLAILINRGTASAAEITAGAIRDNDMGILIGQPSFGKGVYQQVIDFPDGSALKVTAGEYFTPLGHVVNHVGLAPDIELATDEDPIEAAIQWVEEHAGSEMPMDLSPQPAA